jgi:RNA polymerase sigma-70 factor (ECF subfamily)
LYNPSPYTDKELLLKIAEGDQVAFSILFEQYRNRLFTYLFKITKSAETSEEIVLDVFLKIWHGKEAIIEIENIDAFLFKVAHNKAIDFLRSLKRNPQIQQQAWDQMQEPFSTEVADKQLLFKGALEMVEHAIHQLPSQRQKVFTMRHHHGLTNEDIAERLQLSRNTVRNHHALSVQFIRKFLSTNLDLLFLIFLLKK